jgi:hypothetical protein
VSLILTSILSILLLQQMPELPHSTSSKACSDRLDTNRWSLI